MSIKLKQLKEERLSLYQKVDDLRKSMEGKRGSSEEREAYTKAIADVEEKDKEIKEEERYLELQKKQVESTVKEERKGDLEKRQMDAFRKDLQGQPLSTEERAAITGQTGAVLIPSTIANAVEIALANAGGMFAVAEIINTTNGGDFTMPTINDTAAKATIVAEYAESSEATKTISSKTLKAFTYRTPIVPISYELLQDSAFDLESLIINLLSQSFERGLNEHFTVGTGTGQPSGVLKDAFAVNAAAAAAITTDDLLALRGKVPSAYQKNGKFMFSQETLMALWSLKDGDQRYIWQPTLAADIPATLLGKPYQLNDDMEAIAASKSPVIYGDLSKYKIRMVKGFTYMKFNEVYAKNLAVGLMGYGRADGVLLDAGTHPVAKLKMKAS